MPFRPVRPHQNTWQVLMAPDMSVCLGPFYYINRSLSGSNIGLNHGLSTNNRNSCNAQSSSLSSVFSLSTSALAASWLASSPHSFSIIFLVLSLVLTIFWYMVSIRFLALASSSLVFFLLGLHSNASSCRKAWAPFQRLLLQKSFNKTTFMCHAQVRHRQCKWIVLLGLHSNASSCRKAWAPFQRLLLQKSFNKTTFMCHAQVRHRQCKWIHLCFLPASPYIYSPVHESVTFQLIP